MEIESGWSESLVEKRLQQGSNYRQLLHGMSDEQARVIYKALDWAIESDVFQPYGISIEGYDEHFRIATELWEELQQVFSDEED
jgi:DNA polymerase IIIc chi subunit